MRSSMRSWSNFCQVNNHGNLSVEGCGKRLAAAESGGCDLLENLHAMLHGEPLRIFSAQS